MDWIDWFTLNAIARPALLPFMSFEMTTDEREAAEKLRRKGLVIHRFGCWFATQAGRAALRSDDGRNAY